MKFFFVILLTCFLLVECLETFATQGIERTSRSRATVREISEEADPKYEQACFSMGRMTIDYSTGEPGLSKAGFRVTDPRGREIAYDPGTNRGRQELPLAQAYLDCEENDETGELRQCKDHIEICGPVSGMYRIELSPVQNAKFSVEVSAVNMRIRTRSGYDVTSSRADLQGETRGHAPAVLLLHYSREAGTQVTLTEDIHDLANR